MKDTCSFKECSNKVFENGKCVLHCEKDHWFEQKEFRCDNNNTKTYIDWSKSSRSIKEFWLQIREFINKQNSEILFYEIIFPKFEQINNLEMIRGRINNNTSTYIILKNNQHFWESGTARIFDKPVSFMNCTFLGKVDFSYIVFKNAVNIRNSTFKNNIQINKSQFNDQLYFCEDTKINELRIDYSTKINKLKLENITLSDDLFIKSPEIDKLEIINNKKINKIRIHDSEINAIIIKSNNIINDFILKNIVIKEKVNISENCENIIDNFEINDCTFNDSSYIGIKKMNFNNFSIIDNDNISDAFCLYDTKIENKIRLEYTDISNFEFYNFDITNSEKIFKNVSFISNNGFTIFNGVKWGDIDKIKGNRDTFRQLKYVNEQQGNIIEANKFYSAEMEAYKDEIKNDKSSESAKDKFVFGINYLISDFSRDWVLPLIWYFVFGFLFSFIYYLDLTVFKHQGFISSFLLFLSIIFFVLDFKKFNGFRKTLKILFITSGLNYFMNVTKASFEKLFLFINPLNTSGLEDNKTRLIWWILFRIISVFIIYQFIISLRRQTRR